MKNYWVMDKILNAWKDYMEDKGFNLSNATDDDFMYAGFEHFAEYVLNEFPGLGEYPNASFDIDYCWQNFDYEHSNPDEINRWSGKSVKAALEELITDPDDSVFLEYIDNDLIAEEFSDRYFDGMLDPFFNGKWGSDLSEKDRQTIIDALKDGDVHTFENGFSFSPSEFVTECTTEYLDENGSKWKKAALADEGKLWLSSYLTYGEKMDKELEYDVYYCVNLADLASNAVPMKPEDKQD